MDTRSIDAFLTVAATVSYNTTAAVFGNETVKELAEKIATFVNYNRELIFGCAAALSFLFGPIPFVAGVMLGLWAYGKDFTVNPDKIQFSFHELFESPKAELACMVTAVFSRFLIGGSVSSLAVGFFTGCYVRHLLIGGHAAPAHAQA